MLPTCSSMSFGRSSCSSIVKIARLISSLESFNLGGGGKGELFPAQHSGKAQEPFLTHLCNMNSQQQHHNWLYPACYEGGCVRNVVGPCSAQGSAQH